MIRASLCLDSIVTQYKGAGSSGPLFVRLNTAAQEDHRQKIRTDPLYAQVVRDSRRQWQAEHADCQNVYWQAHLEAAERNRERQRDRQRRIGTARSYAMPAAGGGDGLFQKEVLAQRAVADRSPAQACIDCARSRVTALRLTTAFCSACLGLPVTYAINPKSVTWSMIVRFVAIRNVTI